MGLEQGNDNRAEGQQGDKVGDGHEAVECIGEVPDKIQGHRGTHQGQCGPYPFVNFNGFNAGDVFQTFGAIVEPAQNGGKGKENQAESNDELAYAGQCSRIGSGGQGQRRTGRR